MTLYDILVFNGDIPWYSIGLFWVPFLFHPLFKQSHDLVRSTYPKEPCNGTFAVPQRQPLRPSRGLMDQTWQMRTSCFGKGRSFAQLIVKMAIEIVDLPDLPIEYFWMVIHTLENGWQDEAAFFLPNLPNFCGGPLRMAILRSLAPPEIWMAFK